MSSSRCHPQLGPPRPPRPHRSQRPLQQQPAAKGSLRSLLLQHSSKRLYVHPLKWTSLHLSLLCCIVINDQLNTDHCCLSQGPWRKDALELWPRIRRSITSSRRNDHSRTLMTYLGMNAQRDCQICSGSLAFRYNQKPVCHLQLPLMAWYNKTCLWAYIDSNWINDLHEEYKPRQNVFLERAKRAVDEKDLPISPFCMAVILAMAQQVTPGQQVTLFLFDHELPSDSDQIISTFYEYTLQASQTYLSKFDQSYDAFESELNIHRRVIPLKRNMLKVLSDAVQRAATGPGDQAETAASTDREAAITNSPYPVDLAKRKPLDELDSNILVKRVKSSNHEGKE
ncbi:uncharacterized protein LY89DRAFT_722911 [Mollisia scopiformis]|uniref:Uncharacterized protein n=1 Tax=Mollisia scopiformis TaxID=149040 RepID=A0A194WTV2_MOLSC|nr:uncharacterized protein LY89DRAFT_722911 [Mollisia scopiformis]KUJ11042.1 hypothetical protein LY89DRAFT_722911 [Mollisia scopiformis]